jgi:hypothetical protein
MALDNTSVNDVAAGTDAAAASTVTPPVKIGKGPRDDVEVARENWRRYEYVVSRGHIDYSNEARRNYDFYLGGGLQWDRAVRDYMENVEGRPATECNEVMGAVDSIVGYQIANRMDVQFVPADADANPATAKALGKVIKQIFEKTKYKWKETQVFTDGLIAQRGYFDYRITIGDDGQAEIEIETIDPMDAIPDPDAKDYEPDKWLDFIVTRWLTADEIGERYGAAAQQAALDAGIQREGDFGDGTFDDSITRNRFGDPNTTANEFAGDLGDADTAKDFRFRVVDRRHHVHEWSNVAVYPTGEVVSIDQVPPENLAAIKATPNVLLTKRRIKRVRWTVSASKAVLLHDDWSPFSRMNVVPYFPRFIRGRTRGIVDNAISPQETLNKAISQAINITNTSANSGWISEQNSITNMPEGGLEEKGGMSGLHIEVKENAKWPVKIQANPVPAGITNLITVSRDNIKAVTRVNDALLGNNQQDLSGVAMQSQQYAAQQNQAMPLDNLARSRHMGAELLLEFVQKFMPNERVIRITKQGQFGSPEQEQVPVNQVQPDGSILHDLTLGTYDVIISDQPMQITFDNTNFEQIKSLAKDFQFRIPPAVALRYSNLPDKPEIAPLLDQANTPTPDPEKQAKAGLLAAQTQQATAKTDDIKADTVQKKVTSTYSATQTAAQAAVHAGIAGVADAILAVAGFEGANPIPQGPIGLDTAVPGLDPGAVPAKTTMLPTNTNPETPVHPDRGVDAGIEGGHSSPHP